MPDQALFEDFNQNVLEKPEVFLNKSEAPAEQAKAITKYLYDLGMKNKQPTRIQVSNNSLEFHHSFFLSKSTFVLQ